jgi:hypothetical protein
MKAIRLTKHRDGLYYIASDDPQSRFLLAHLTGGLADFRVLEVDK